MDNYKLTTNIVPILRNDYGIICFHFEILFYIAFDNFFNATQNTHDGFLLFDDCFVLLNCKQRANSDCERLGEGYLSINQGVMGVEGISGFMV